jgi:hypothetical protein
MGPASLTKTLYPPPGLPTRVSLTLLQTVPSIGWQLRRMACSYEFSPMNASSEAGPNNGREPRSGH